MRLRRAGLELVAASFVVLFQELALIRWIGGEVRVLAYFPNVVLISAFLGLGAGALRAGKRSLLWLWPVSIAVITIATLAMARVAFTNRSPSEHLWLLYLDIPNAPVVHDVRPPIVIAFILSALSFVALGQFVGERLREFTAAGKTLWGYVADLTGSLLGVIAFAAASFTGAFPAVWFAVFLAVGAFLFLPRNAGVSPAGLQASSPASAAGRRRASRRDGGVPLYAAIAVVVVASIAYFERADHYSPYYALRTQRPANAGGVYVLANGSLHQYAAPLGRGRALTNAYDRSIAAGYPLPYGALRTPPRRVLILGAGTGNDVVTALQNGAQEIDAVEIDPVILRIGREMHPDRPYDSPRVHVFNTDARAFLRNSRKQYDLIVFGTLDSMTRLSALSNVRLDNFVYTVDCMRAARERLAPRGGVALYFMVGNRAIHQKLLAMLTEAFGAPPLVRPENHQVFNEIFIAGPAFEHLHSPEMDAGAARILEEVAQTDVPTDDWPFLYLDARRPPAFYLSMIAVFMILSAGTLLLASPELARDRFRGFDAEMFLFGAAFLLLETKLVTQMSLVWGTTWVTSAVVFGSILATILIGTIAMQLRPLPYGAAAGGLVVTLVLTFLVPSKWLLVEGLSQRLLLSLLFAGAPIFFASICFAIRFRARAESNAAFGWNLAGAVFGGLIESMSMATGIRAMTLVALAAYLASFLIARSREAATAGAR
jgi:SAM-dependent methyltransferase